MKLYKFEGNPSDYELHPMGEDWFCENITIQIKSEHNFYIKNVGILKVAKILKKINLI